MNNSVTYRWTKQVEFKTAGPSVRCLSGIQLKYWNINCLKVKQFQNRHQTNTTTERRNVGSNIRQYKFQTKDYYQNEKNISKMINGYILLKTQF